MPHLLIVTGGNSSERDISLISSENVRRAAEINGYIVDLFDFQEGQEALVEHVQGADVVFPVMHGKEGEDGTLYRYLRSLGKPYVGSDPDGAFIAFDKVQTKQFFDERHIATAPWSIVQDVMDVVQFGFPCVLKAANGGSSREVLPVMDAQDLECDRAKELLQLTHTLFVESYLSGVEVTVGVLLDQALPVIEIVPPSGGWFDDRNKYSGESQELPFAPSLSEDVQVSAQQIALQIHRDLHLGAFSRTDMIVVDGAPVVLEVNTPGGVGLTPESLFPKAAKAAGISFEQFVETVLNAAL